MEFMDAPRALGGARGVLCYATVDGDIEGFQREARAKGVPLFGATSFQGVFTPRGFERGAFGLAFEPADRVTLAHALIDTSAPRARRDVEQAVARLEAELGGKPDAVLVHATPGFEERVLEGLASGGWGSPISVAGGSAADDDLSGAWRVFDAERSLSEGALVVAFRADATVHAGFVSGYFGTKRRGRVTRCTGRTVHTIDGRPAAEVLDEWMSGALAEARKTGGSVLAETTLSPIGRVVDRTHRVPRYLLSHPHELHADTQAVSFFTELEEGDEIELMMGTRGSLLDRTQQVVDRAIGRGQRPPLGGGVLIYCGGCVGAIGDGTGEVARIYREAVGGVPFLGAATFGEVGPFDIQGERVARYGNLMCDTLLFGR